MWKMHRHLFRHGNCLWKRCLPKDQKNLNGLTGEVVGGVSIVFACALRGAISIFHKHPEDSLSPPPLEMGEYMERLIVNRRSCRRYLDQNVEPWVVSKF